MARPKILSQRRILDAAWSQLRTSGIEGLSMRGLGKDLGVEAMSLYKHVGRREELLTHLRLDLFQSMELGEPTGSPRRDLETVCLALFRRLRQFEGAAVLLLQAPSDFNDDDRSASPRSESGASPHLRVWERMLIPLRKWIPEALDRAYALRALYGFVLGQAAALESSDRDEGAVVLSEVSDNFHEVRDVAHELGVCVPDVTFELGLRVFLDALEERRGF